MDRLRITFEHPMYLTLLLVIPLIIWIGRNSLAGLGPWRSALAVVLRSIVCAMIVFALAGIQWVWTSDRTCVIYILDQSDSIPALKRQLMLDYAIANVKAHRNASRDDQAGLIIFGREAAIEFPPLDENLPPIQQPESFFGESDATNLEAALKLAQATFPENAARRIVVLTDGNETLGTAAPTAKSLTDSGIGIDVIPVKLDSQAEVLVEKIDIPGNVRQGQPVEARVVLERFSETNEPVSGRLRVVQSAGRSQQVLADQQIELERDVNVITLPHVIDQPAGYSYEATFIPDTKSSDAISQNNSATAFTYVQGKGRVLLIEDVARVGEYDNLIESLRRSNIEVDVRDTANLFANLIELQAYDAVILAGTPRTSGENADVQSFSDSQVDMLVQSVQQFGIGLLMIGGPEALGAGGWANTKLEEAMPVDFQIKNSKVEAVGALAMVMHASEIASGNYWQKMIGRAALESLGPLDYCGVVQFDFAGDKWLWGGANGMLRVGPNKQSMLQRLNAMTPGDMPDFQPSMQLALSGLKATTASMKHMIIISDGDPSPPSNSILNGFANEGIKISTVAVGAHGAAGHQTLQKIANVTGGNYYVVTNARALPKIFMREARRVSRSQLFEDSSGIGTQIVASHEALTGISRELPSISGYVLTQLKDSPLVERPIRASKPAEEDVSTILATWTYGLGRTAVFSSDSGRRWAADWANWSQFDQFFSQLVRWMMRPSKEDANYSIFTTYRDGRIEVVVNATDEDDRFVNFLEMAGAAVGPDLKPFSFKLAQQSAGRYVGSIPAEQAGAYVLNVVPGPGQAPLTTGVSVPFSAEYRIRQTNTRLLRQLSELQPVGGSVGTMTEPLDRAEWESLLALDSFRPGVPQVRSLQDIWPWAVLFGATLFFADCFVRRVAIDLLAPLKAFQKRRAKQAEVDAAAAARLDRLRTTKQESTASSTSLAGGFAENRSQTFQSTESASQRPDGEFGASSAAESKKSSPAAKPSLAKDSEDELSYTERLLRAKKSGKKDPKD